MGEFKETRTSEPAGQSETLVLHPSFHQDGIYDQTIYIAGSEDTVSFASLQCHRSSHSQYVQFWFTPEEIDLLIIGLLQAKTKIEKTI